LAPQLQYVPFPFPPLKPKEEKGGDTPILISPPAALILGPEMTVAGKPTTMSIPIPRLRHSSRGEMEKRDKEAGNPHSSSSSSSFPPSSLSCDPWTRGRNNGYPPTGVCNGVVSGVILNDGGKVFSLVSSFVVGSEEVVHGKLERVPPPPAQEESTNPSL